MACLMCIFFYSPSTIRTHLQKPQLIFLSLAPFYKKLGRLIYDWFLIFLSRTDNHTKCLFELQFLAIKWKSSFEEPLFKTESKSSSHAMRPFQF